MKTRITISDRCRALCYIDHEYDALRQEVWKLNHAVKLQLQKFSQEHEALIKKMIALDDLRAKL